MAAMPSQEEMAAMQRLSETYTPDHQGPLVGDKQPTYTLSAAYATADPVYVQKTAALARTYSHYRVMRGDGNCGWRAIAFLYFEVLLQLRDEAKVQAEVTRITSLKSLLNNAGHDEMLYEDFVDVTIELLNKTAEAIRNGWSESYLTDAFNDATTSSAIITHLRLLTSAQMKTNPQIYLPFMSVPVESYCASHIEPFQVEIEHFGIQGLMDVLIGPAGFKIEISYLDRTAGEQVNVISIDPSTPIYANPPTLRLLFKPDHYDILYLPETTPTETVTQVNIAHHTQQYEPYGTVESDYRGGYGDDLFNLSVMIPGLSLVSSSGPSSSVPAATSPSYFSPTPAYPSSTPSAATPEEGSTPLSPPSSGDPFRVVRQTYEPMKHIPYKTKPFKEGDRSSSFNPAHYLNDEFQPEQYHPGDNYKT